MKRKILFIAIIMIFTLVMFIQNVNAKIGESIWEEEYTKGKSHMLCDMIETSDGGFIIVGYKNSDNENYKSDGIIIKYDSNHKVEWEKTYGKEGNDEFAAVTETLDGNFVVVGLSNSTGLAIDEMDIIIVKYDNKGNVLKEQTTSYDGRDYPFDIIETSTGDFIVVGRTDATNIDNAGWEDGIIIKLNSEFVVETTKTIGKEGMDDLYKVIETKDKGFVVIGSIEEEFYQQALMLKLDKNLNEEWRIIEEKEGETITSINSVIETSDGSILTVGDKQDLMTNMPIGIITKRSNDGKIIWHKEIKGTAEEAVFYRDVIELLNGGYIAVGDVSKKLDINSIEAEWMGLITKYDEDGNIEWKKTHGELSDREEFTNVVELKNKEIVTLGQKDSSTGTSLIDTIIVGYKEYLKTIEVTNIIEPLEGESPVYEGIKVPEDANYKLDTVAWFVSNTEDGDYERMDENEKFEAGKYYRIQLEFVTKNGYEFLSPINATINEKTAVAMTTYTESQAFAILEFGKLEEAKIYNVIEGANQTYTIGESDSATFKIDAEFDKFRNVKIDEKEITDFTAKSGSTVITLDKSYVESLTIGEHTLDVTFTDGRATTKFTIAEKEEPSNPDTPTIPGSGEDVPMQPTTPDDGEDTPGGNSGATSEGLPGIPEPEKDTDTSSSPKTGDNIVLYISIFVIAILGLVATVFIKKKRK